LIDEGDERAAFDDFARAINSDPACWSAYQNRAITYATYGQHDDAFRDFATAIELNPDTADLYRNRAELHAQLGRWLAAEEDLSRAIAVAPTDGDLRALRGEFYQRQGKSELAAAEFDAAVTLESTSASALTHRASLAARIGDYDRAIIDYDAALQRDPYHAATYQGVAWLLSTCPDARYRDSKKALEAASRARRFGAANDPVVLDAVAAAHASAGNFDSAIQLAQQAASLASPALRAEIQRRISLYQARQPYRCAASETLIPR
jgi:tetratricopeptide (TPR) repeat protein